MWKPLRSRLQSGRRRSSNFGIPTGRTAASEAMFQTVNAGWIDLGVDGTEPAAVRRPHAGSRRGPASHDGVTAMFKLDQVEIERRLFGATSRIPVGLAKRDTKTECPDHKITKGLQAVSQNAAGVSCRNRNSQTARGLTGEWSIS